MRQSKEGAIETACSVLGLPKVEKFVVSKMENTTIFFLILIINNYTYVS